MKKTRSFSSCPSISKKLQSLRTSQSSTTSTGRGIFRRSRANRTYQRWPSCGPFFTGSSAGHWRKCPSYCCFIIPHSGFPAFSSAVHKYKQENMFLSQILKDFLPIRFSLIWTISSMWHKPACILRLQVYLYPNTLMLFTSVKTSLCAQRKSPPPESHTHALKYLKYSKMVSSYQFYRLYIINGFIGNLKMCYLDRSAKIFY